MSTVTTDTPVPTPERERESPRQKMIVWGFRFADATAQALPEWLGRLIFNRFGRLGGRLSKVGVPNAYANFAQVLGRPEDSEVVRATVREAIDRYAAYWYEACRISVMDEDDFNARMTTDGVEHIRADMEAGTGSVMVMPHMGNWDAAGHWMAMHDFPMVAVAEALKPRRLLQLFMDSRAKLGLKILPLEKGAKVGEQLAAHLADNWVVALVADRDLSGRGIDVEMFGKVRKLPAGPAALAISSAAPLHVCGVYETERGWHATIGPALTFEPTGDEREDVAALTREMGRTFEKLIAASPSDWHMFQRAWPDPS